MIRWRTLIVNYSGFYKTCVCMVSISLFYIFHISVRSYFDSTNEMREYIRTCVCICVCTPVYAQYTGELWERVVQIPTTHQYTYEHAHTYNSNISYLNTLVCIGNEIIIIIILLLLCEMGEIIRSILIRILLTNIATKLN